MWITERAFLYISIEISFAPAKIRCGGLCKAPTILVQSQPLLANRPLDCRDSGEGWAKRNQVVTKRYTLHSLILHCHEVLKKGK